MTPHLTLADLPTRDDLRVFLERLQRAGESEVRLVTRGDALAVYGCTMAPFGLTDPGPVVLGMRTFALEDAADSVDATVQGRALLDRLARLGPVARRLDVPDVTVAAAWAGVLPPLGGWERAGALDGASLVTVARDGAQRVAKALPTDPGEALVRRVRREVWGQPMVPGIPAAAAFAADALGFLNAGEPVSVSRSRAWTRLTTPQGHVLVRDSTSLGLAVVG